ncbi:hypothetical protein RHIZ404_210624 [Rhizobium sp. EC-SD404]|nr:hypothetical protein RHIZ404_210624 [Rhizobium sp. EC-SD404]
MRQGRHADGGLTFFWPTAYNRSIYFIARLIAFWSIHGHCAGYNRRGKAASASSRKGPPAR